MKDLVLDHMLTIGIDEIDEDHNKLINLFNILNHSITEGAATDYVESVLEELINCTVWHFSHEERLMLKYGYDALEEHRDEHQDLIISVRELQQKFRQSGKLDERRSRVSAALVNRTYSRCRYKIRLFSYRSHVGIARDCLFRITIFTLRQVLLQPFRSG